MVLMRLLRSMRGGRVANMVLLRLRRSRLLGKIVRRALMDRRHLVRLWLLLRPLTKDLFRQRRRVRGLRWPVQNLLGERSSSRSTERRAANSTASESINLICWHELVTVTLLAHTRTLGLLRSL